MLVAIGLLIAVIFSILIFLVFTKRSVFKITVVSCFINTFKVMAFFAVAFSVGLHIAVALLFLIVGTPLLFSWMKFLIGGIVSVLTALAMVSLFSWVMALMQGMFPTYSEQGQDAIEQHGYLFTKWDRMTKRVRWAWNSFWAKFRRTPKGLDWVKNV
jgi:hypothetical protein